MTCPPLSHPPGPKPPTLAIGAGLPQPGLQDTSHTASSQPRSCKVALPRRAPGFGARPLPPTHQADGLRKEMRASHQPSITHALEHGWALPGILCANAKARSCTRARCSLSTLRSWTRPGGPSIAICL
ncbi:MAG: hypothetical protein WDW38_010653 [Sanguina aurantia]